MNYEIDDNGIIKKYYNLGYEVAYSNAENPKIEKRLLLKNGYRQLGDTEWLINDDSRKVIKVSF